MITKKNLTSFVFIAIAAVILSSCAPKIISFTPKRGEEGTEVTINGNRFKQNAADNTVKFGDTTATEILQASTNKIVVKVPAGAQTGLLSVTTNRGTGESKKNFIVEIEEGAKWTFMVYLDADNNLESAGIDDFLEMATVGSSSDVNIVVQMDRTAGEDNTFGDWTSTRRFLINKDDTPDMTPLSDLGEQNMGHPDTLRDFVLWAIQNYPAEHYALSIWNHGDGWRTLMERKLMPRARAPETTPGEETITLRTVATDVDNGNDVLFMKEVQDALQAAKARLEERGMTKAKLDVVGFDACLMGMIEVSYALRNVANYMVGSEWLEPGDGWPYDTILSALINTPTFDGSDLSGMIVTKYGLAYSSGITQSSIDVSKLNDLIGKMDAFAGALNTEWAALKTARENTITYHPFGSWFPSGWGVDLWDFADNVYNEVTSTTIKNAALDVKNAIDAFVTNEQHSSDKNGSHGVAIYFPPNKAVYDNDPDHTGYLQENDVYPVDFVKLHSWDEFLKAFYENTEDD